MAKKKSTARKSAKKKRPAAKKKTTKKKPAKKNAAAKKAPAKKAPVKKPVKKKSAAKKKPAAKKRTAAKSLGRARIAGDARLDLVFHKDYSARNAFEFLGVSTFRELAQLCPDDIVEKLTRPAVETVQRIRKTLAMLNRSLIGDRNFAVEFRDEMKTGK